VILGHSMGGLVARSACHAGADHAWRSQLRTLITLGSPHHGAPLERGGNWISLLLGISRYSAPLVQLARIRSAGITDLRYGNVLDEHWHGRDRFEHRADDRSPLALPADVRCYTIAGTLSPGPGARLRSDGLVPVDSALGAHATEALTLAFPAAHRSIAYGTGHRQLLGSSAVYDTLRTWLS
jgi:pimeloyl-ACP methyl ester carboxylesterase